MKCLMSLQFVLTDCYEPSQGIDNGVWILALQSRAKDIAIAIEGSNIISTFWVSQASSISICCFSQVSRNTPATCFPNA
jgi:hypothetical protein